MSEVKVNPEWDGRPRNLHIVCTGSTEQEMHGGHLSLTMIIYANPGQISSLLGYLEGFGVGDDNGGKESTSGIYIASSDLALNPTGSVSIAEFVDQNRIAAQLAHATHIVNAAVNVACSEMAAEVLQQKENLMLSAAADLIAGNMRGDPHSQGRHMYIPSVVKDVLYRVFEPSYDRANQLLKCDIDKVLARFDGVTKNYILQQEGDSTLWKYVSEVGIGLKSFTNARSPSALLGENRELVSVIVALILQKSPLEGYSSLEAFLNTPREDFHAVLQKAARGPNGAIGFAGIGLEGRLQVELEERNRQTVYKFGFDQAAQLELTEQVRDHRDKLVQVINLVNGPIADYCRQEGIRVEVIPSHYARYQVGCPVLRKAWIGDGDLSNTDPQTASEGNQPHQIASRHFHHPGYEGPQQAYMGQVELVYAVLGRLKNLIDYQLAQGEL